MRWYLEAMKKYAVFSGRARRKRYWMFTLMNLLIVFVLGIVEGILRIASDSDESVLGGVYILATLIPGIAVGVRRMHDTDHSGWWFLVPIVNLIFAIQGGQQGPNRFGPDLKGASGRGRRCRCRSRGGRVRPTSRSVWRADWRSALAAVRDF